jgi:hypothetical protein
MYVKTTMTDLGMAFGFGAADNSDFCYCRNSWYFSGVIRPYVGGEQATMISVVLFSITVTVQSLGIFASFEAVGIASLQCEMFGSVITSPVVISITFNAIGFTAVGWGAASFFFGG